MLKRILIKILFRLLEGKPKYEDFERKWISEWLAIQWKDKRYHEYCQWRKGKLMTLLSSGLKPEDYQLYLGHLLELKYQSQLMEKVTKLKEKRSGKDKQKKKKKNE